jgi:hypothetical protein
MRLGPSVVQCCRMRMGPCTTPLCSAAACAARLGHAGVPKLVADVKESAGAAGVLVFYVNLTLAAWIKFPTLASAATLMTVVFGLGAAYFVVCIFTPRHALQFSGPQRLPLLVLVGKVVMQRLHACGGVLRVVLGCLWLALDGWMTYDLLLLLAQLQCSPFCSGSWHVLESLVCVERLQGCCPLGLVLCAGDPCALAAPHHRLCRGGAWAQSQGGCRLALVLLGAVADTRLFWRLILLCCPTQESDMPMGLPFDWHLRPRRLGMSPSSAHLSKLESMEGRHENGHAAAVQ